MQAVLNQAASTETASPDVEDASPLQANKIRIVYGVQGTGNGHISRASAMNKALSAVGGYDVTWVMSGRPRQDLMCCDDYRWYRGMTFSTGNGRIEFLNTIAGNNVLQFFRDIREFSLDEFDLVLSDFEPVVSWAARKQGRQVLGIGHQYAFRHNVPVAGHNPVAEMMMKYFAPADIGVGLHWHHFDQSILPPIVDMHSVSIEQEQVPGKVLVYLPFENQDSLVRLFQEMPEWNFYVYSPEMEDFNLGNVHTRAISKTGFKNDLVTSSAIITNSGFELISECLTLGKRILTKPLHGQIEQLSNAKALSELGYATVIDRIEQRTIANWLSTRDSVYRVNYPDVAGAIAGWLGEKDQVSVEALSESLWEQTSVKKIAG